MAAAEAEVGRAAAQAGEKGKMGWARRGNSWPRFSFFFLFSFLFPI
jgi:hypothetical protein